MSKVLTVYVNDKRELIKYETTVGGTGHKVYHVETTIVAIDSFSFWIEGSQAVYVKTNSEENSIKEQIMRQISKKEK